VHLDVSVSSEIPAGPFGEVPARVRPHTRPALRLAISRVTPEVQDSFLSRRDKLPACPPPSQDLWMGQAGSLSLRSCRNTKVFLEGPAKPPARGGRARARPQIPHELRPPASATLPASRSSASSPFPRIRVQSAVPDTGTPGPV